MGDQASPASLEGTYPAVEVLNGQWTLSGKIVAGIEREIYAVAAHRGHTELGAEEYGYASGGGPGILERMGGRVCVVCGQGDGELVRMVDRAFGGHTRAPPEGEVSKGEVGG